MQSLYLDQGKFDDAIQTTDIHKWQEALSLSRDQPPRA